MVPNQPAGVGAASRDRSSSVTVPDRGSTDFLVTSVVPNEPAGGASCTGDGAGGVAIADPAPVVIPNQPASVFCAGDGAGGVAVYDLTAIVAVAVAPNQPADVFVAPYCDRGEAVPYCPSRVPSDQSADVNAALYCAGGVAVAYCPCVPSGQSARSHTPGHFGVNQPDSRKVGTLSPAKKANVR